MSYTRTVRNDPDLGLMVSVHLPETGTHINGVPVVCTEMFCIVPTGTDVHGVQQAIHEHINVHGSSPAAVLITDSKAASELLEEMRDKASYRVVRPLTSDGGAK
jgi:hypothetical protein